MHSAIKSDLYISKIYSKNRKLCTIMKFVEREEVFSKFCHLYDFNVSPSGHSPPGKLSDCSENYPTLCELFFHAPLCEIGLTILWLTSCQRLC